MYFCKRCPSSFVRSKDLNKHLNKNKCKLLDIEPSRPTDLDTGMVNDENLNTWNIGKSQGGKKRTMRSAQSEKDFENEMMKQDFQKGVLQYTRVNTTMDTWNN
jgi:hypothetical protein